MRHDEQTSRTPDGATVFWQQWLPDTEPRAVICLVHGLGEHSTRYEHLAGRFTDAGCAVYSFDLRGHGNSGGTRGDTRFPETLSDIAALLSDAHDDFPDLPVFLYGHSLGGLLSMTFVVQERPDIAGIVASAPALDTTLREQKAKFAMAKVLGGVAPGVAIPSGLDSSAVSRDRAVVAAYDADPLVHDQGSLGLAKQSFGAMDALAEITTFPAPLLIIHGTADSLTVPTASKEFVDRVTGDITLIEYEGLFHEPHNEPEQEQVFADVLAWLEPRITSRT